MVRRWSKHNIRRCKGLNSMPAPSHRMSKTRTYRIWCGVKARCDTPSATGYSNYGALGVTYAPHWAKFELFLSDMGPAPDGMTLDRIDGSKGYTPDNCRWATPAEQSRNTSRNVTVGPENLLARDVAANNGISQATFKKRLYCYGWPVEEACGLKPRAQ